MQHNNDYNILSLTADEHSGFPVRLYPHISEGVAQPPLHRTHELVLVISYHGVLRLSAADTEVMLSAGQAALMNSGVLHSLYAEQGAVCAGIAFSDEFIAPAGSDISLKYIKPLVMNSDFSYVVFDGSEPWHGKVTANASKAISLMHRYLGSVGKYPSQDDILFEESPCCELDVHCLISDIWKTFYINMYRSIGTETVGNEHVIRRRTQLMIDYIHKNYGKPISLSEIAAAANISKSEASRCFQSCLHVSPVSYLLRYRVEMAADLLQNSSMTIDAISFECGFGSASYFCRMFQRYVGTTPGRFRKSAGERL